MQGNDCRRYLRRLRKTAGWPQHTQACHFGAICEHQHQYRKRGNIRINLRRVYRDSWLLAHGEQTAYQPVKPCVVLSPDGAGWWAGVPAAAAQPGPLETRHDESGGPGAQTLLHAVQCEGEPQQRILPKLWDGIQLRASA